MWPFLGAVVILPCAGLEFYASRRGKFLVWSQLVEGLKLCGDEQILDIGCGRGAILMLAAQRLVTGRAIGVDLWRKGDQSGNAAQGTERNAVAEGGGGEAGTPTGSFFGFDRHRDFTASLRHIFGRNLPV
jgi:arsenite methyltransferase